jgi:hypothetical protein
MVTDLLTPIREARKAAKAERDKLLAGVRDDLSGMVSQLAKTALSRLRAALQNGHKGSDVTWTDGEITHYTQEAAKILRRSLEAGIISGIERKKAYLGLKVQEARAKTKTKTSYAFGTWAWDKGIESPEVRKWLEEKAGKWSAEKMATFTKSIRQAVGESVGKGIAEGESWNQLIERVQSIEEEFTDYHSLLIAQMETSTAFSAGSSELFKQTGIAHKSWHWDGGQCNAMSDDGIDDICPWNESLGIVPIDFQYSSMFGKIDMPPAHFNCSCDVYPELGPNE